MKAYITAKAGTWGVSTCTLENAAGVQCGATASKHVLIDLGKISGCLNTCDRCFIYLIQVRVHITDSHPFGDLCNLPHADWVYSDTNGPGTCRTPDDLTEDVERFANQPEGALTCTP